MPANILILLDSSASMNNKIGGGNPRISSMTIDGNEIVLSSVDKKGGLYLFDSDGVRINFTGIKQTTNTSYTRDVWFTGGQTMLHVTGELEQTQIYLKILILVHINDFMRCNMFLT